MSAGQGRPEQKRPAPKSRPFWTGRVSKRPGQNWYFSVAFTVRPGSL